IVMIMLISKKESKETTHKDDEYIYH
ncbi:hypothetical protein NL782_12840, partial [Staphylococcus aureus]|nr:hypothetical protein [Staphylococcus aureus]MDR4650670.1 hypothetical protein [Staphylococcus aureus]